MEKHFMKLLPISHAQYEYYLNKKKTQYIDYQDIGECYKLNEAMVRLVDDPKINGIFIHGLFSLKKGDGKKLLRKVIKSFRKKAIFRLNCTGDDLKKYYESIGFEEYFRIESYKIKGKNYYEMIYKKSNSHKGNLS